MKQLDGNIWHTALIKERLKELDQCLNELEARFKRDPTNRRIIGVHEFTKKTHDLNVRILRRLNPDYYEYSQSTLVIQ